MADKTMVSLQLTQSNSWGYKDRTIDNIKGAEFTVAIAVDFSTAGERLTQNQSEYLGKYVGVSVKATPAFMASAVKAFIFKQRERTRNPSKDVTLNMAGNGMYTFARHDYTQPQLNQIVFDFLKELAKWYNVTAIRSGGQTGLDHAALVAGLASGIPVLGHYPKGFRRRDEHNIDMEFPEVQIRQEIIQEAAVLNPDLISPLGSMLLDIVTPPEGCLG